MAQQIFVVLLTITLFPLLITALSYCGDLCETKDYCYYKLVCRKGKCMDDPDVGTSLCRGHLSSRVTGSTRAILTYNDFGKGGDGGGASECDGRYHEKSERVVALSTGWYAGGIRCGKMITIRASNGRTTIAKVVDECDSKNGCKKNIVNGSSSVWGDLGLDIDAGEVAITWTMA